MRDLLLPVGDRLLDVRLQGAADGPVLVYHHGTPGWRQPPAPIVAEALRRGLRLVSWSRPGYAGSTRQPGRTVADAATDLVTVLDALGIERVHVLGWSGGGPHALACAALAPDRVLGAALLASVAPYDAAGLDWLAGMGEDNLEEFGAAVAGEDALRGFLDAAREELAEVTGEQLVSAMSSLLPAVDVAVLAEDGLAADGLAADGPGAGGLGDDLAESFRQAVSTGVDGWLDDDLAFTSPWGFDPTAAGAPVHVWQGDADLMVPFAHGQWLADRLGPRAHLLAGEGHLSLVVESIGEVLDRLTA
jgi:pimeloyl-ACP methyl ester carboxylesterase